MSERVIKPSELTDVQVLIGIRDGRFSQTPSRFWDDGQGQLWAYVESLGIVGYVRAGSFSEAWECAEDEIMDDGDTADAVRDLSPEEVDDGELNEGYGYRNSGTPSNPKLTSNIYSQDLNGSQLVPVTDAYAEEHGIEITVREDDDDNADDNEGAKLMAYKWAHPSEWLNDHVDESRGDNAELFSIINTLMSKLSEDDIQDLFQPEMDRDGYFTPIGDDNDQDDNDQESD